MTFCRGDSTWDSDGTPFIRPNISLLLKPGTPCEFKSNAVLNLVRHRRNLDVGRQVGSKNRRKRAWILPGTLWCGRGSSAGTYEQLGMFEHVDRCCREHDHCSHVIRPFTVNFGVFNPTLFTISHCNCDHRFKQCLLNVNDSVSNMVGYTFFHILKLRCFDLIQKRRCTQLNWFGM
ncbi:acidic phospholipase A2 PA4 [Salminus brasiliensis]|uniref:acidic phospholipase A2 PA4 n=1 Tax=Salminus brasiliensis TaxID=930266 RepID=UPI003B83267C